MLARLVTVVALSLPLCGCATSGGYTGDPHESPSIVVLGDAERPGAYQFADNLSSLPALLAAAGVRMDAEGFVDVSHEGNIRRYPLRRILINDPPLPKLQSGDIVRISYKEG